jgi:hypothetical protein
MQEGFGFFNEMPEEIAYKIASLKATEFIEYCFQLFIILILTLQI